MDHDNILEFWIFTEKKLT